MGTIEWQLYDAARAYRRELDTAISAMKALVGEAPDAEVRARWQEERRRYTERKAYVDDLVCMKGIVRKDGGVNP